MKQVNMDVVGDSAGVLYIIRAPDLVGRGRITIASSEGPRGIEAR